jgi:hypothetical protein
LSAHEVFNLDSPAKINFKNNKGEIMSQTNSNERILAHKTARVIKDEELTQIGGGSNNGTTVYSTKETFDIRGNWDTGGDIQ